MNDRTILNLMKLIDNPYLISIITLIISIAIIFRKSISNSVIKLLKSKKKITRIEDLLEHNVFNSLEAVSQEVKVMKFYTHKDYDRVKSIMCYDFTKSKAKVCASHMREMLLNPRLRKMKNIELKNFIIDAQNNMHKEYVGSVKQIWMSKGIAEEDVNYVIHLFEVFRYDVIASFTKSIESIFGSGFHHSNFDKILAVLNMWSMGIHLLPKDMQITFENLNGKFKDIKY